MGHLAINVVRRNIQIMYLETNWYNNSFAEKHEISALAGIEISQYDTEGTQSINMCMDIIKIFIICSSLWVWY